MITGQVLDKFLCILQGKLYMDLRVFLPVFSTILIDERGDQTQIANPPIQQDR